jgi:protoporphyrinogen oxidase
MEERKKTWGIIGGGIMGMTLALRLSQKGYDVTILECSERLGGLTSPVEMNGVVWDRFYHVILMSDLNTRRLINEIGLEDKLRWVETKTGFYCGGKLFSMSDIFEFLKFPGLNLINKSRLGITIIVASMIRDWRKMEKIPVEKWLCRWSGRKVFDKIWLPLLRAKLGDNYKETSASFIWTTIQRLYAARRTGLKKEMFGYLSGGYAAINGAFEEKLKSIGVILKVNIKVEKVVRDRSGKMQVETASSGNYFFDEVISTVSSDISVMIAPSMDISEIKKHNDIKYIGVICPSLLLKNPISEYYVTNILDTWSPFTGIIEMTALVDPAQFGNQNLVYLPKYVESGNELFNKSDAELKVYFVEPLFRMYPGLSDKDIIHFSISSARRVFSLPTLQYSEKLPSVTTTLQGYHILNSAQIINGTNNVNETIQVAEIKLEEILNSFPKN